MKTETKEREAQLPLVDEAITGELIPAAEVIAEKTLQLQERALINYLQNIEDGAKRLARRVAILDQARIEAIRSTRPEDWVLSKDQQGSVSAMLCGPGAAIVAQVYGLRLDNVGPINPSTGRFEPLKEEIAPGVYQLSAWCDAYNPVTGGHLKSLPATRRSDEKFIGRSVDGSGRLAYKAEDMVGPNPADMSKAVWTLLLTSAVRTSCGMSRVPPRDLQRAWEGTNKKIDDCRKGHGFGSSAERKTSAIADEDVKDAAGKLRDTILSLVGGDAGAARKLLLEVTSDGEKFKGHDSVEKMTKGWQIEKALAKLEAHAVFGEAYKAGKR